MADTQWPRYQVFVQERERDPFLDVGSVHAPDPEMALLNARDVFVRRPSCVALWVVPAAAITSRTIEEIQEHPLALPDTAGQAQLYYVFTKTRHSGTQTYTGSLEAHSPEEALRLAIETLPTPRPALAWWIVPAAAVVENDPFEAPSFFEPAFDKPFRLSTDFHTVSAMRQLRRGSQELPAGDDSIPAEPERIEP
jgi:ring-1,2-phenylacetyl-CoA epoxidase subunit PaaB